MHFPTSESGFVKIGETTLKPGPMGVAYLANYAAIVADQTRDSFESEADADRAVDILNEAIVAINKMGAK
jgi:hypothetical protein